MVTHDKTSKQLKKHVNAIHCSNETTLLQRKLFNALTFIAYPTLLEDQLFEIQTSKLCKLIGYKSNDVGKLRDALSHMMSTVVHWSIVSFDRQQKDSTSEKTLYWEASTMIAAARIKNGICSFEFSSILKERLYHPERYARLDMDVICKLKSKYGIALYENCIRFQGLKFTPWFEIDDFRTIMGANLLNEKGEVKTRKYTDYKDFKKRVINPGITEVNTNTYLHLELEEERDVKKKVIKVRFKQSKHVQKDKKIESVDLNNAQLKDIQNAFAISEKVINKLDTEYGLDYLLEKFKLVMNSRSYKSGKIKDLASYYISAVKDNFKTSLSSNSKLINDNKEKRVREALLREHREKIEESYKHYIMREYTEYLNSLTIDSVVTVQEEFLAYLKHEDSVRFLMFEKFGFENTIVQDLFRSYIINNIVKKEKIIKDLQEFESDYINEFVEVV